MARQKDKAERGGRGSADLGLQAGYEVLIDQGVGAVNVGALATRLGLSRTSVYWHFPDREALLAALVARWRGQNTGNPVAQTEAFAETVTEAVLNLFDCWVSPVLFDSRLEFAIRNWAQGAPDLAAQVAEQDALRLAALRVMFRRFGFGEIEADTRARTIYLTQIGYISMQSREDWAERLARIPTYARVFTGVDPSPAELARFEARHAADAAVTSAG